MIISLDTETTGTDFHHGAKAFLVTIGREKGDPIYWEWDVDPLTRMPDVPESDLAEIQYYIDNTDKIVLQNTKFDFAALRSVHPRLRWDWDKVEDTLILGHLLSSNTSHRLSDMVMVYLRRDMDPPEKKIKELTNEARRWARSNHKDVWMIAKKDLPTMPSAKETVWKLDMWLPRAIAKDQDYAEDHPFWYSCAVYANTDSTYTLDLFNTQKEIMRERGLERIYRERLKVLRISSDMQDVGIHINGGRLEELTSAYSRQLKRCSHTCNRIAKNYGVDDLVLPKAGNNKSLMETVFTHMGVEPFKKSTKTGLPSLDKFCMTHYLETLDGDKLEFMESLRDRRKRMTAIQYMKGYRKFWIPTSVTDWYVLHPSLNPTGTDTLRWSSKNPNEQNISKQEGFNLRYCFGPMPGREWWSLDAKNIELRIPAYEAEEKEMIALFEKPDEAPYFGSNHLLVFHLLWGEKLRTRGYDANKDPEALVRAKKDFASTWYQWTKNGNFAVQYGAVPSSGTADRAYHVDGGQELVQKRFRRIALFNRSMIKHAKDYGYVETAIDKTVDPDRGYPLTCPTDEHGRIIPTVPLNYHVQGSAMWWMMKAMIRCDGYLRRLNEEGPEQYHMIMQVHDELVFDFPAGGKKNAGKLRMIKRLMEQGGDDFGMPTPVSVDYHPNNWSE